MKCTTLAQKKRVIRLDAYAIMMIHKYIMNDRNDVNLEHDAPTQRQNFLNREKTPYMASLVIKTGLVETEKQANIVLIIVIFILLLLSGFVFLYYGTEPSNFKKEQIDQANKGMQNALTIISTKR